MNKEVKQSWMGKVDWIIVTISSIVILAFLYYNTVNFLLKDVVLPNISINEKNVAFLNYQELSSLYNIDETEEILGEVDGIEFELPLNKIEISYPIEDVLSFGKGVNPIKVWSEGYELIEGISIKQEYLINIEDVLSNLPFDFDSDNPSRIEGDKVICIGNQYHAEVDLIYLESQVRESLGENIPLNISLSKLVLDDDQREVIQLCEQKNSELEELNLLLNDFITYTGADIDEILWYKVDNRGEGYWSEKEDSDLYDLLINYSRSIDKNISVGDYRNTGEGIYLFDTYKSGLKMDIQESYNRISQWNGEEEELIIVEDIVFKLFENRNLLDYSNVLGAGKSRMLLKVDGRRNPSLSNAEGGLLLVDNAKILPGGQFSFIDTVADSKDYSGNEHNIGYGTCNSTTTIFRAALEAGFPIDERHSHSFYVPSYDWGYPYNFVDAAYFPNPRLDLRFTNDLSSSILLRVVISEDTEYQYHTVEVRSSPLVLNREVVLGNWKYLDKYSDTSYTGEFTRYIKDISGNIIKTDTFMSRYR